jgi:hypothetical protein
MYIHKYDEVTRKFFAVKTKGEIKCLISTNYTEPMATGTAAVAGTDIARRVRPAFPVRRDLSVRKVRREYRAR